MAHTIRPKRIGANRCSAGSVLNRASTWSGKNKKSAKQQRQKNKTERYQNGDY